LLEEAVAHHELLGSATDVAVVVQNAHASEPGNVDLESNVLGHVNVNVGFLRGVGTRGLGSAEVIEAFVSDFINHFYYYNLS